MSSPPRYTTEEWLLEIGSNLKTLRLSAQPRPLTREEVADRAQVGVAAVKRLEDGKGSTLATFVSVLRALGESARLSGLAPAPEFSPLDLLQKTNSRQRAPRRQGNRKA